MAYITLLWKRPGTRDTVYFDPDYGMQYKPMNGYRYGVNDGQTTLKHGEAFDKLMQPIWDGAPFADLIPVIPDNPPQYIQINQPINHYPDDIPPFRDYPHYRAYNENEDVNGGHKWYYLYAPDVESLEYWDTLNISHWEDPLINDDETWIINPDYTAWLQARELAVDEYRDDLTRRWDNGCQLLMIAEVRFPVIPDDPFTEWFTVTDNVQTKIPVEPGKYTKERQIRWRKVVDWETQNRRDMIEMYITNSILYKQLYGGEEAVKYLAGLR